MRLARADLARLLRRILVGAVALVSLLTTSCSPAPEADPTVDVPQRVARWTAWLPGGLGEPVAATVVGESVVVLGNHDGVAVFDRGTGALRWQYAAKERDAPRKVRVTGDAVVFLFDSLVQVRDLRTGALRRELMQVRTAAVTWTTLYVARGCADACPLTAFDVSTGRQRWQHDAPVWQVVAEAGESLQPQTNPARQRWQSLRAPEPAVVLVRTGQPPDDALTAVDAVTGAPRSTHPFPVPADSRTGVALGSAETYLHWIHSGQCRVSVAAYSLRDGHQTWTAEFGAWEWVPEPTCGPWTPDFVAGGLLGATLSGRPRLVDVDAGLVRWTGEPTAHQVAAAENCPSAATRCPAAPSATGTVIVRGDNGVGNLVAVDARTGERRWSGRLPKGAAGARKQVAHPVAGGGNLAYQTEYLAPAGAENLLWLRDLATGQISWVARDAGRPISIGADWLVTSDGAATSAPPRAPTPVGPNGPSPTPTGATTTGYPIRLFQP